MGIRLLIVTLVLGAAPVALAQNSELRALEREDQAVRTGDTTIKRSDNDRVARVLALLAEGAARTPEDQFDAAVVLQHTPFSICNGKLASMSPDNYLLAHYLFTRSLAGGDKDARYLVAASIDRYLWMTAGYQKYGTNRAINRQTGQEELVPIDRSVTDSERAVYGVPPLGELLRRWPEQAWPDSSRQPGARPRSDSVKHGELPHHQPS